MNITRSEVATFAVAVRNAVDRENAMMPDLFIMAVAARVDFKSDNLKQQVNDVVDQLIREHPTVEPSRGAGEPVRRPILERIKKIEATRDRLVALGAKVQVRHRKLAHRMKVYLYIKAAGGHFEWKSIIMPAIHKDFPDAYMTSGGFWTEMNLTIALEK